MPKGFRNPEVLLTAEDMKKIPKAQLYSPIPEVENAINPEFLSVRVYKGSPAIFYKDVPLWRTSIPLEAFHIFLYDASKAELEDMPGYKEPYILMCVDFFQDVYTYGCWNTLEEAQEWLKNPKREY